MAYSIAIGRLRRRPPFSELFRIDPDVRDAIVANMHKRKYDEAQPIVVWKEDEELIVVDGHTRLEAALLAGLTHVVIVEQRFEDELDALIYALHRQRDRRLHTGADLVHAIEIVDATRRKAHGGDRNPYGRDGKPEIKSPNGLLISAGDGKRSRDDVAELVGTSATTVQRARMIYDDPEAMERVRAGVSITRAAEEARERKLAKSEHDPSRPLAQLIPRYDDEAWFKAKTVGSIVATKLGMVERYLREELDRLEREGVCVADLMGDRRVSREWGANGKDGALRAAYDITALIRQATRGE